MCVCISLSCLGLGSLRLYYRGLSFHSLAYFILASFVLSEQKVFTISFHQRRLRETKDHLQMLLLPFSQRFLFTYFRTDPLVASCCPSWPPSVSCTCRDRAGHSLCESGPLLSLQSHLWCVPDPPSETWAGSGVAHCVQPMWDDRWSDPWCHPVIMWHRFNMHIEQMNIRINTIVVIAKHTKWLI